ncbi:hypothetical protein ABZS83_37660 [Streptomyces sp. NPDC005426]|uniref:hypothetical protein n=1 Tax=Streptomyces sp. NPDC005426 TaxID=3155344 RepID=UPI00339F1A20
MDKWLNLTAAGARSARARRERPRSHGRPSIRFVPVADTPAATVYLARPVHTTHPRTEDLMAAIRDVASSG